MKNTPHRKERVNPMSAMNAVRNAWQLTANPANINMLREVNKKLHGKSLKKRHPRARTNGAFGNMSKFNKRLKAQANN